MSPSAGPAYPRVRRQSHHSLDRSTPSADVGGESSATQQGPPAKKKRVINRGLTCANCRARKTRCDGGQPGCKTCEVYQDTCRYDQIPPLSQILALTQRLQDAERTISQLQTRLDGIDQPAIALEPGTRPMQSPSPTHLGLARSSSTGVSVAARDRVFADGIQIPQPALLTPEAGMIQAGADERIAGTSAQDNGDGLAPDFSLDEFGQLCYYGPTSHLHDPPTNSPDATRQPETPQIASDVRNMLKSNALESRNWEEFALGTIAMQSDIPLATMSKLLSIHWTWLAPTFMWVYRPAFMRDMTAGGQYYSTFLLTVLCAHTARYEESRTIGDILIARARALLASELHKPSSIPTVQALLQLSARDLAYGRISQAWLYSGMAFRMVSDLGLHHSNTKVLSTLGHLNHEDMEIRRRLFWSCYFWDKAISLYLGRMPVLLEVPLANEPQLLDDTVENEIWTPVTAGGNLSRCPIGQYPSYRSHAISAFINSCRLCVIISDIIQQLYATRRGSLTQGVLDELDSRLGQWRKSSPAHLVLETDRLPDWSPPPHIMTQNLLYRATVILLHRPFISKSSHRSICRFEAEQTEKLLLLLEKTFGFTRLTYLMAYCAYTSASITLQDYRAGLPDAQRRMQTFLRALTAALTTCPVLQRSIDIINNALNQRPPAPTSTIIAPPSLSTLTSAIRNEPVADDPMALFDWGNDISAQDGRLGGSGDPNVLLPAFLFGDSQPQPSSWSGVDFGAGTSLDCFPEIQLDASGMSRWT